MWSLELLGFFCTCEEETYLGRKPHERAGVYGLFVRYPQEKIGFVLWCTEKFVRTVPKSLFCAFYSYRATWKI